MAKKNPPSLNVLIIDKHVLIRQTVSNILRKMNGMNAIHSVSSIDEKFAKSDISRIQPDVIILGMDTPDSKEMKILSIIRDKYPIIPVVLLTPLNGIGATTALKGLKMGAVEFITKPDKNVGVMLATRHFRKRIVPLMNIIHDLNTSFLLANRSSEQTVLVVNKVSDKKPQKTSNSVELMVVAGCTGGVLSLFDLISNLPDEIPVPIIIIQHMPKIYTRKLAEELDKITPMNVREAQNDSPLIPGQIYLAPGAYHTEVRNEGNRKKLYTHRGPREKKNRPSIDVVLRTAVQAYDNKVLSVFLSGGGNDGLEGAGYVMDAGGKLLLQDKESSLVWHLPSQISELYPAQPQIHVKKLGTEIMKNIMGSRSKKNMQYSSENTAKWFYGEADS
ncbi:chemotaxis response regulator protein-glutamate methylesterase [soil metagenome]